MGGKLRFRETGLRALALAAIGSLAACGGGGGGGTVRPDPPPAGTDGIGFTPTVTHDASLTQLQPPTVPNQAAPVTFADPAINQHLVQTNAARALGAELKGQGVTIGFLDSGVNRNHPALSGRVVRNFVNLGPGNDLSVDDKVGHGTVVAALAAGRATTGRYRGGETAYWGGGVAPGATIVSSRIIGDTRQPDDGSGQGNEIGPGQGYGDFFQAVNTELANAGAKIINNSWGGLYWTNPALTTEFGNAWRDFVVNRGGLIVFATGNEGRTNPSDNASLPSQRGPEELRRPAADLERGWLAVTAVDPDNVNQLDRYTDERGSTVVYANACGIAMNYCLAAPGTAVFIDPDTTTQGGGTLYQGSGTSFAAPLVSGAAAVVWAAFPYFNNDQVRQTILGGARDIGAPGVDPVFGWGLLDVGKAANGPSHFGWGDFSVSFAGHSVWWNAITGGGGLVKDGSGTLSLMSSQTYTGDTRVVAGGLDVRGGLASNLIVSHGATVWARGAFSRNVTNHGLFINAAENAADIVGTAGFTQGADGHLGIWLGSPLRIGGTARLAGQVSVLGVKSGYVTTARETLLTAHGGVSGTFDSLRAAPNVFLDASLGYDPNNVFLDIKRIDVSKAVARLGMPRVVQASSVRIEAAMQAIDAQLDGNPRGIGTAFIEAAGALQHVDSVALAERAIGSLSGALHAAADAAGLDMLDAGRRALSARFDELIGPSRPHGDWHRALGQPGRGGAVSGRFLSDGWLVGHDRAWGASGAAGFAFGTTVAEGVLDAGYDRSHERQVQARFYAGALRDHVYVLGQFGAGRYQRQLRRTVLLGDRMHGVATDYAGRFATANLEAGRRFGGADHALTPYAGLDHVRLQHDGFVEHGADGFGLRTRTGTVERTLATAGLRAMHRWTAARGLSWSLHGHVEWQRALQGDDLEVQASFVGAEAWSPLYGATHARSSGLFGLGVEARPWRHATLSLGYDRRFGSLRDDGQWLARLRYER